MIGRLADLVCIPIRMADLTKWPSHPVSNGYILKLPLCGNIEHP